MSDVSFFFFAFSHRILVGFFCALGATSSWMFNLNSYRNIEHAYNNNTAKWSFEMQVQGLEFTVTSFVNVSNYSYHCNSDSESVSCYWYSTTYIWPHTYASQCFHNSFYPIYSNGKMLILFYKAFGNALDELICAMYWATEPHEKKKCIARVREETANKSNRTRGTYGRVDERGMGVKNKTIVKYQ